MPQPFPSKKVLSDLKASILNPAQTSHFQCWFNPPNPVKAWVEERADISLGNGYTGKEEFFSLSCSEASLPGSSLATHTITNDHPGITERHAYRRQYDTTASFTFYVDHDYEVIHFFENWIAYIVNEAQTDELVRPNYFYRVQFPINYKTHIYLKKFEKDYSGRVLQYDFLESYPISIDSMPIRYDRSELLRCTVNFNFSRYVVHGRDDLNDGRDDDFTILPIEPIAGGPVPDGGFGPF